MFCGHQRPALDVLFRSESLHLFSEQQRRRDLVRGGAALPLRWGERADPHHCLREDWLLPGGELLEALLPVRDRWGISAPNTVFSFVCLCFFLSSSLFSSHTWLLLSPSTVKPDTVPIRKVNSTTIVWSYPSSWSSPFSYFPLTFQIAQLNGRCKRCDNPCTDSKAKKVRGPGWL